VSGGPEASIITVMRAGAYTQMARRSLAGDGGEVLAPLDWLRLGTLDGARALGLENRIGSLEVGKEADMIAIDPGLAGAMPGSPVDADPEDLMSRLIFRAHPEMVRAAWVRGRALAGPAKQRVDA
jgi:cytosine/adenosine deaminase-related metal-dependent hydrolase